MGEIVASVDLENTADRNIVSAGLRDESTIRRTTVDGVVDTGAVMLVLPENVVGCLGLETQRQVVVAYADERKETRPVAGPVTVRIGNRFMISECVVGPPLSEPLIAGSCSKRWTSSPTAPIARLRRGRNRRTAPCSN